MAEAKRYKEINGEKVEVQSAQQQKQGVGGDLEQRILELERYVEKLESVMKVETTLVKFLTPIWTDREIYFNGVSLRAGTGAPSAADGSRGSLYTRRDGNNGSTLYAKYSGGWDSLN